MFSQNMFLFHISLLLTSLAKLNSFDSPITYENSYVTERTFVTVLKIVNTHVTGVLPVRFYPSSLAACFEP